MDIYKFQFAIQGDIPSFESFPIYDDNNVLIGAFSLYSGDFIRCFVATTGYPAAIKVSTNDDFYFTLKEGSNGKVAYGVISEVAISPTSILVNPLPWDC